MPTRRQFLAAAAALAAAPIQAADTPRRGAFVAVGYGGRRLYSADGVAWEIAAEWQANGGDDSNNLMGLTFGKGNFVAVGGGGAGKTGGGHILVSSDGKAWREVKSFSSRVNPVLFGDGRFVAGGPDRRLLWSDDAETWHDGPAIGNTAASHFRHGAAGNGRFLFVGNGRKPTSKTESTEIHWAVSSRDGTAVESEIDDLPPVRGLAFGNGRFVLVGLGGFRASSADGRVWSHRAEEAGTDLTWVVWTGKQFLAGGNKTTFESPDGLTWTTWPAKVGVHVLYADSGRWVGTTWAGNMWASADGKTWKRGAPLSPNGINQAVYGEP